MSMLIEPLHITTPIAAFNGGMLVNHDVSVIEQRVIPGELDSTGEDSGRDGLLRVQQQEADRPPQGTARSCRQPVQAALYREVVYLMDQSVLDIAAADDAVSWCPGLRWG
jgi:hypothetical protein